MNLLIVDDEHYIVNYLFALIEEHIENRFEYSESLFWIRSAGNPFNF